MRQRHARVLLLLLLAAAGPLGSLAAGGATPSGNSTKPHPFDVGETSSQLFLDIAGAAAAPAQRVRGRRGTERRPRRRQALGQRFFDS